MKKRCPNCRLINFPDCAECARCRFDLIEVSAEAQSAFVKSAILKRAIICAAVCVVALAGFYFSLIFTSAALKPDEQRRIDDAVRLLDAKGFDTDVFLLEYLTSFRANDNWLNASAKFENAYAATNFPFEIITVYPDFFQFPADDVERAAILLHEARHLKGADEREAYEFVWRNRRKLGWTQKTHGKSIVFQNIRRQTREFAPDLFTCEWNPNGDCTETE